MMTDLTYTHDGMFTRFDELAARIAPGSFGQACIDGDLEAAAAREDWVNVAHVNSQIEWCKRYLR